MIELPIQDKRILAQWAIARVIMILRGGGSLIRTLDDMQKAYELAKDVLSASEQLAKNAYKCIIRAIRL